MKIFGHDGMKIPDAVEEQIEDELRAIRRDDVDDSGDRRSTTTRELIERYEHFLDDGVAPDALRGRKVVLDTGNGAAFRIAPEVFRRAGAEVVVINDQPNGRNINDGCGAMHPEGLAKVVVEEKADFGVAFDGDADRAIFADDAGKIRDGDEIIYLWAQRLKRNGALQRRLRRHDRDVELRLRAAAARRRHRALPRQRRRQVRPRDDARARRQSSAASSPATSST